ncbi:MAG TPA: SMP-30/gluconolactonase/LRE family protein [Acidimicrobiales bacterium]
MDEYTSRIISEGLSFGEAPRWHESRLWFSDFYRLGVYSVKADGTDEKLEHRVEGQPSGLGWLPGGDLLCVSCVDHRVLRFGAGSVREFADISDYCGFWANDMAVSATGYSYVGNFGFDLDTLLAEVGVEGLLASPPPTTNLVVLNQDGQVIQSVADMAFPNGTVLTPDGATLIVGETLGPRLTAFDVHSDGTLSNRRVWAPLDFVATDGMCLDADGQIWLADALANRCLRVKEGGEITGTVTTSQTAFACMLGGENETTLFIMTSPSSNRFEIATKRQGRIEIAEVTSPHAGLP